MRTGDRGAVAMGLGLLAAGLVAAAEPDGTPPGAYLGPAALAVSPDGAVLYAACQDACRVAWVTLPRGPVARWTPLPGRPNGLTLSPDGGTLIVACGGARGTVLVFDAVSGDRIATVPAGHTPASPVVSQDGRRLYVPNRFSGDLAVIDLEACDEVARIPAGREPVAADLTPDGRTLAVASHLPNMRSSGPFRDDVAPQVTVFDTATFARWQVTLTHGANGVRGLCALPDGRHVLVTHLLSNFEQTPFRVDAGWINVNVLSVIDLDQRKVIRTIGLDENNRGAANPYDVMCTPDGSQVCVSVAGTHELCVIGRDELLGEFARRTMQPMMAVWPIYLSLGESLWRRHPLPGLGPRGLAAAGSKVYVAQYFSDSVAVVDFRSPDGPQLSGIPLGPAPAFSVRRRGELLFQDARICYQQWQSCASCHPDGRADGLNWDLMNDGQGNPKNTKSLVWAHRTPPSMAEGVRESAEIAVRSGLVHILFADRPEEEAAAIDAYLQSLRPVASPYRVDGRLSPAAQRGRRLFYDRRIGCDRCHPPPRYTDRKSHNVGTRTRYERNGHFDTPTLVEIWRTAPYLHDGRYLTVEALLKEGRHGLKGNRGQALTDQDIRDLAEFVLSL